MTRPLIFQNHTNMTTSNFKGARAGMTMNELLVTITVIAVITAAAVSQFAGVGDNAGNNAAKRNAQIVASTAENARIAGSAEIVNAENTEEVISLLGQGVEGEGVFEGVVFKISLSDEQRVSVLPFLKFDPSGLVFDPAAKTVE